MPPTRDGDPISLPAAYDTFVTRVLLDKRTLCAERLTGELLQDRPQHLVALGRRRHQLRIAKLLAMRLLGSEYIPGTLRDQPTLLIDQRSERLVVFWVAWPGLLLSPEVLKPARRQLGVSHRVLDIAVA